MTTLNAEGERAKNQTSDCPPTAQGTQDAPQEAGHNGNVKLPSVQAPAERRTRTEESKHGTAPTAASGQGKYACLEAAVLENIKWLDRVLTSGSSLAGIVVLLKLLGFAEFQWVGIKFTPASAWIIGYAWVLFCLFTIAHYYVASLAINSLHKLWLNSSVEESERTFSQVTRTGNIFVRGLLPRTKHFRTAIGLYLYEMRIDDPTAWVSYLSSVLLMLAMVPFDLSNIGTFAIISVLAAYAVVMNWLIGSNWIVALSELVIPRHKSVYHARREQRRSDQRLLKMEGVAGWIGCTAPLLGLTIALLVITLGSLWDNACCLSGIAVLIMLSGSVALWLRYGIDWDSMS